MEKIKRVDPDRYFIEICRATALRSTCIRAKVGAIIVKPNGIIHALGFNGSMKGFEHCLDSGCILDAQNKCIRTVHAEINALIHAQVTEGMYLYSTHLPCFNCIKALVNAGIVKVCYEHFYFDSACTILPDFKLYGEMYQIALLARAGIIVEQIQGEENGSNDKD